ncbi:helix-turn-helix transcriptional regulator [uncultured Sphaerochaeta sp.]|uniref:response regulator transcription factor n=1 Tax=uncultured Sphaerochaeta sp. TaxID=886478 RepID=UPI002A0A3DF9|nr:helix-turn-helix transcriptional regulator [uncultured Sphaerochaeta sp.]
MKKYALLLYENERDKSFLLKRVGSLPWLSCTPERLGDPIIGGKAQLVLGRGSSLPAMLRLKNKIRSQCSLPVLVFSSLQNISVLKALESQNFFVIQEEEEDEDLSILILRLLRKTNFEIESYTLTKREREVVNLIISGQDNQQIAERLGIKLSTVAAHKKNLFLKTGVHTTSQLAVWAIVREFEYPYTKNER